MCLSVERPRCISIIDPDGAKDGANESTDCDALWRNLDHTEPRRSSTPRLVLAGEMLLGLPMERRSVELRANLPKLKPLMEEEEELGVVRPLGSLAPGEEKRREDELSQG